VGGSKEHEHGFCEIEQKKKKNGPYNETPAFSAPGEKCARAHTHAERPSPAMHARFMYTAPRAGAPVRAGQKAGAPFT